MHLVIDVHFDISHVSFPALFEAPGRGDVGVTKGVYTGVFVRTYTD